MDRTHDTPTTDQAPRHTPRRRMLKTLLGVSAAAAGATLVAGGLPTAHANDAAYPFTSADPKATVAAVNTAAGDALTGTNASNGTATGNGVVGARGGSGAGDGVLALRTGDGVGHAI